MEIMSKHCQQENSTCNFSPLLPVPFLIEIDEENKQTQFRKTADGKGGQHGKGQGYIAEPSFPLPVPVHPVIVQIDCQQDKELINTGFPENTAISVPIL